MRFNSQVEPAPEDVENQEVVTKTISKKVTTKKGGKVVESGERDEFDEILEMEEGTKDKSKDKKKDGKSSAIDSDAPKEIAAGTLPASKNTEMGFKQRKVNKRFKSYEVEGGEGGEGEEDDGK